MRAKAFGVQVRGTVWNVRALFKGTSRLHLTLTGYRVDLHLWWRLIRIGAPASVTSMERPVSELVVLGLVTTFGDVTVTAYAISQRVQMLTNMAVNADNLQKQHLAHRDIATDRTWNVDEVSALVAKSGVEADAAVALVLKAVADAVKGK